MIEGAGGVEVPKALFYFFTKENTNYFQAKYCLNVCTVQTKTAPIYSKIYIENR